MATDTDLTFKNAILVDALYDTGASHNFVSKHIVDKLNIDIYFLNKKTLEIVIGNNECINVVCSELKLLLKLNKIFENNDLECSSLVSVKDVFYIYESGQDIIISYPLICDVHKCSDLEGRVTSPGT